MPPKTCRKVQSLSQSCCNTSSSCTDAPRQIGRACSPAHQHTDVPCRTPSNRACSPAHKHTGVPCESIKHASLRDCLGYPRRKCKQPSQVGDWEIFWNVDYSTRMQCLCRICTKIDWNSCDFAKPYSQTCCVSFQRNSSRPTEVLFEGNMQISKVWGEEIEFFEGEDLNELGQ